jgi:hypothetical protein
MGWKETWERYQTAAAFDEAGEHETARRVLEEGSKERLSPGKEDHSPHDPRKGLLRPSHAEG